MDFFKRLLSVFSGNLIFTLSTFIVASVLISNAGLKDYGYFVLLQSFFQAWVVLSKPQTWQSIVKYAPLHNIHSLCCLSFKFEFIYFTVAFSIGIAVSWLLEEYLPLSMSNVALVMFFSYFYMNGTVLGYFRSKSKFMYISVAQGVSGISRCALSCLFYENILFLFLSIVAFDCFIWIVLAINVKLKLKKTAPDNTPSLDFSKVAIWATISQVLDLPVTQLDKILIAALLGVEATGVINLLRKIATSLNQFADPVFQVTYPMFSKLIADKDFLEMKLLYLKVSKVIFLIGCVILTGAYFSFGIVDFYIFDSQLINYFSEFLILIFLQVLVLCFIWLTPVMISLDYYKENTYISALSNLLYLFTIWFFMDSFGLNAVIIGVGAQYLTTVSIKYIIVTRFLSKPGVLNVPHI